MLENLKVGDEVEMRNGDTAIITDINHDPRSPWPIEARFWHRLWGMKIELRFDCNGRECPASQYDLMINKDDSAILK